MPVSVLGQDASGPSASHSWEEGGGTTKMSEEAAGVSQQAKIGAGPL